MSGKLIEELRANATAHPLDVRLQCMADAADALESQAREIERLEAWKAEEMLVMSPLMDYARSACTGPLGCSLPEWLVSDHKRLAYLKGQPAQDALPVAFIPVDRATGDRLAVTGRKGSGLLCDYLPLYLRPATQPEKDPWQASGAEWCSSIHSNPDAKAWADFFVAVFPGQAGKHDLMLGWFANAMMAMHDHLKAHPNVVDERAAFELAYASARSLPVALVQQLRRGDDYAETDGARLGIAWNIWQQARAALTAPAPGECVAGELCFKDARELAEALGGVRCLHDMSVELIAERVFAQSGGC